SKAQETRYPVLYRARFARMGGDFGFWDFQYSIRRVPHPSWSSWFWFQLRSEGWNGGRKLRSGPCSYFIPPFAAQRRGAPLVSWRRPKRQIGGATRQNLATGETMRNNILKLGTVLLLSLAGTEISASGVPKNAESKTGNAPIHGMQPYYEIHGQGK